MHSNAPNYSLDKFEANEGDEVTVFLTNMDDVENLTHGFTIVRYGVTMEISPADDILGHLHGRPARSALVVLPVVLPRSAHGDVRAHDRSSQEGLTMIRPRVPHIGAIVAPLALAIGLAAASARADVIQVKAGESAVEALSRAAPGDTLRLGAGVYKGDLVINVPGVTIEGEPGAILEGERDRQCDLGEGAGRRNSRADNPRIGTDAD